MITSLTRAALDAGALQRRLDRDLAQLMSRQVCKCPVESADRRAGGAHDDDVVFHPKLLLSRAPGHSLIFRHCRILGRPSLAVNSTHLSDIPDNWPFFDVSARDAETVPALPRCHKTVAQRSGNWLCSKPGQGKRVNDMAEDKKEPVTIKKYANRRLYNTGTSTYVTLEDLATMVKNGEDFIVYDAKTGEDITRSVLAQIIFEQENKEGQSLLPITFLRQLIRFYGDSMQMLVPRFLEASIESLSRAGKISRADGPGLRRRSLRAPRGSGTPQHGNV